MVALGGTFNAHAVPPVGQLELLPTGWYKVIMVSSDWKPARTTQDAFMLALEFEVIDGEYKGRKVFWNLNLKHPNDQTVEIALGQLSALCWVTGQFQVSDTAVMHNIPLQIYVVKQTITKDRSTTGQEKDLNSVNGVRDINGQEPWKHATQQPQQPQAAPQPQQAASQAAPQAAPPPQPQAAPQQPQAAPTWAGAGQTGGWQPNAGQAPQTAPAAPAAPQFAGPPKQEGPPWGNR